MNRPDERAQGMHPVLADVVDAELLAWMSLAEDALPHAAVAKSRRLR